MKSETLPFGLCWSDRLAAEVLMEPLDLSFYACVFVCLCTRALVCICASAYVGGLGSGTPEYTHWNVKCVCFERHEGKECLLNSL